MDAFLDPQNFKSVAAQIEPWRGIVFFGILIMFTALEIAFPRRQNLMKIGARWRINFFLGALNIVLLRLLLPLGLIGVAGLYDGGLIPHLNISPLAGFVLSILVLDLIIYAQHRLFHIIPLFWRFHQVHHSDLDLDTSSAVRFHPGEAFLSFIIKAIAVMAFGIGANAILIFEILLSSFALFNHSNIGFGKLDRVLQLLIVTPDMHRLHHSRDHEEVKMNFGFCLSLWDRLLRTYQENPRIEMTHLPLGIEAYQNTQPNVVETLTLPFKATTDKTNNVARFKTHKEK